MNGQRGLLAHLLLTVFPPIGSRLRSRDGPSARRAGGLRAEGWRLVRDQKRQPVILRPNAKRSPTPHRLDVRPARPDRCVARSTAGRILIGDPTHVVRTA